MRDLLLQAVVFASLPVAVFRPFVGLLVFSWLAYMRPQNLAWGVSLPLSLYTAAATLLGLGLALLQRERTERLFSNSPQTVLLLAFWAWVTVTTQVAVNPEAAAGSQQQFTKIVLLTLVTTGLVRNWARLRMLLLVISFSLGFLGFKYAIYTILRAGARFKDGPGGFMSDNNLFAVALNMAIPLLVGVALTEKNRIIKIAALSLAACCMITVFFTFSRGGLLTLGVVAMALLVRSGRPLLAAIVLTMSVAGSFYIASDNLRTAYFDRASTISTYEEDGSAMARFRTWNRALQVAKDYPIFGVGPDNLEEVHHHYDPDNDFSVTHNTFLQILAECGVPALVLFLSLMLTSAYRLQLLRKRDSSRNVNALAGMFQVSLLAFAAGGIFVDRAFFDLFYTVVALSICLEQVAGQVPQAEPETRQVEAGEPWWRRTQQPAHRSVLR